MQYAPKYKPNDVKYILKAFIMQNTTPNCARNMGRSISSKSGKTYEEILRSIHFEDERYLKSEIPYLIDDFIQNNNSKMREIGTFDVEQLKCTISYRIVDGKFYFVEVASVNTSKLYHKNEYINDKERTVIMNTIRKSIAEKYPLLKDGTPINFNLIEIAENTNGVATLQDVIDYFRTLVDNGSIMEAVGRINSGYIEYRLTCLIKNSKQVNGLEPVDFDGFLFVWEDGVAGLCSNGFTVGVKLNENKKYNIIVRGSNKKVIRFCDNYPKAVQIYKGFKDGYEGTNIWGEYELDEEFEFNSIEEIYSKLYSLVNELSQHTLTNINTGFYRTPKDSKRDSEYLYTKDTKFKDMLVENATYTINGITRYETAEEKEKRTLSNASILNIFSREMNSDGMMVTDDCRKYAATITGRKGINKKQLMELSVEEVCRLATYIAMTRPYSQYKSKQIGNELKQFKDTTLKVLSSFNPDLMENKDKFIKYQENKLKRQNCNNEDALEMIFEDKDIKDIDLKSQFEEMYKQQKEDYDFIISELEHFKYADKLDGESALKLAKFYRKYYKATKKRLKIQNFKLETIDLTKEVIEQNNQFVKETNNKELKREFKALNKDLKKVIRVLSKNMIKETTYADYKTEKRFIEAQPLFEGVKSKLQNLIENKDLLKSGYNITNLSRLLENINEIINKKYEIKATEVYSFDYGNLDNEFIRIDRQMRFGYIM